MGADNPDVHCSTRDGKKKSDSANGICAGQERVTLHKVDNDRSPGELSSIIFWSVSPRLSPRPSLRPFWPKARSSRARTRDGSSSASRRRQPMPSGPRHTRAGRANERLWVLGRLQGAVVSVLACGHEGWRQRRVSELRCMRLPRTIVVPAATPFAAEACKLRSQTRRIQRQQGASGLQAPPCHCLISRSLVAANIGARKPWKSGPCCRGVLTKTMAWHE